ncbi:hypothetical protein HDV06_002792 [Boothiomyces sp. JEL0866]|nr:hypothetical protein HDV06_002792 [Boothiomyces sp. JEL0866]
MPVDIEKKAYLIGGGIASLSSAVYLIKEGFNPQNIHILEHLQVAGGSMDAHPHNDPKGKGHLFRGGRMFDQEAYTCLFDLLENIPSPVNPGKNCKDDIFEFSKLVPTSAKKRLLDDRGEFDVSHLGLSLKDSTALSVLLYIPESQIQDKKINDYFSASFFTSNFWYMFCTTFAFQPWHSLIEVKRYFRRFLHEVPKLHDLSGVWRTMFNQYDSIIKPTQDWLVNQGVNFDFGITVTHLDFIVTDEYRAVEKINYKKDGKNDTIQVSLDDLVFTTLGSLTAGSAVGTHTEAPKFDFESCKNDPTWILWSDIAKRQPDFGRPEKFFKDSRASCFESFSVTLKDGGKLLQRIVEWSGNKPGTGALVTFPKSSWFFSIVVPFQPHFKDQPEDTQVFWAYGLNVENIGDYVKKPMIECSGQEFVTELLHHLKWEDMIDTTIENSICIPAILPFTMAQFMPRQIHDRPQVIPKNSKNFAFLGQFVEVPEDVVFTVEYSVRCAQTAVFHFMKSNRKVLPIYRYTLHDIIDSGRAVLA